MKNRFLKLISTLLVLVLLVNMLPMQIFAEEYQRSLTAEQTEESIIPPDATTDISSEEVSPEDAYVVAEITENRTEYSKEFLLSNGLYMTSVYADPVHYETETGWEEIDNTLQTNPDGSYSNTAGIWDVTFPEQLGEDESVTIQKDGYTLSFSMSGELTDSGAMVMSAGLDDAPLQTFGFTEVQPAIGEIQEMDTSAVEQAEHPEAVPDKLQAQITYPEVYEDTDVVYDLDSNTVKESMILESYDPDLQGYSYTLEVGTMIPVLDEDGTVTLYDENQENIIMVMPAPYLIDNSGVQNHDIQVQLVGSGDTYTLMYLLPTDWLAAEDRSWPVLLDPLVQGNTSATNIQDRTVVNNSSYPYIDEDLYVGYKNVSSTSNDYRIHRSYIKYNTLPKLGASDVVVYAEICMYSSKGLTAASLDIAAHKVTEYWTSSTISWADQPDWDSNVEDYAGVNIPGYYNWDITDIVQSWYATENHGLMLKSVDETATGTTKYRTFGSSDSTVGIKPVLLILTRNNNGLEGYWDYTTSSAGRAGTGYVNHYTGNLVWVREDVGVGGNRMPVSISHIYNLNDSANNEFGLGYGWRTNYNQLVYRWNVNDDYYIWEDADGTDHYFKDDGTNTNTYKDEDGLELTLTTNGTGDKKFCITDKTGNCSYFDNNGRLHQLVNNQAIKSSITVAYDGSSKRITSITDSVGRVYTFQYNNNNLLTKIYFTKNSTEYDSVTFGYSSGYLTTVTDRDGKSSSYSYSEHLLTSVEDIDGYKLTYTYNTVAEGIDWQPYRVKSVAETDGDANGGELTFEYYHNQTNITDYWEETLVYQFNDFGNTVSVQDGEGRAQFTEFARFDRDDTEGKANQLKLSSKLQSTVVNLVANGTFERSPLEWEANARNTVSVGFSNEKEYKGNYSLKAENTDTKEHAVIGPTVTVPAGKSITFSAYLYLSSGSLRIGLYECNGAAEYRSSATQTGCGYWMRCQTTYTNETNTAKQFQPILFLGANSTAYMDCVQVELVTAASRFNYVDNGDFRGGTARWEDGDGMVVNTDSATQYLSGNAYQLVGVPDEAKSVTQTINVKGNKGNSIIIAGWAKACSVPCNDNDRTFGIFISFNGKYVFNLDYYLEFNPDTNGWQYAAKNIIAPSEFTSIEITLCYDYNANTAYFDGIQLYLENFGERYTYDEDGNVVAIKDLLNQKTEYKYQQNQLTEIIADGNTKMTYTYDENNNVTTATSATRVCYTFEYDSYGNNTSVSTTKNGKTLRSTATYTNNGDFLKTTKDALGNITTYQYNENTGVLEWVKYPNDTDNTRTTYSYDTMYRTAKAECTTNTSTKFSTSYTYTDDLLTQISTPSTTYHFTYQEFGLRTGISVGNQSLATYTYSTDRKYNLQKLDYGNRDSVEYTYDDEDRLIRETYEDETYISYRYNDEGELSQIYDSQTGITSSYYYDFVGRLKKYTETGEEHSYSLSYTYDEEGQLSKVVEILDGHDRESTYSYDEAGKITFFEKVLARRRYGYDAFGRVSSTTTLGQGMDTVYNTTYTFNDTATTASGQVTALHHQSTYNNAHPYDRTYSYTYDDNGNILSVSDGANTTSYVYDSLNQLLRENNQAGGFTHTWKYDNAGNILERKEYAYTTGTLGAATATVNYTYGDSNWKDKLTSYGGTAITYDKIGNPQSDGEWNYTWRHGRQLASMSDGETTWTYTYGQNGLRTNRTDGTTNYRYVYDGSQLTFMARNGLYLRFAYTPEGTPLSVLYKGTTYYYVTNLQGDVVAILTGKGYVAVEYTYDAWGNLLSTTGSLANTLGKYNPLRYRGYVYDYETGLYYLQSRYYNPEIGRFINADNYAATGQGFVGNNMFAYCNNNPVIHIDVTGSFAGVLKALAYTTVTVPQLLPIVIVAAAVIIVADPNLREKIADGFEFISATVRTWVDEAEQAIKERLTVSLAKANPPKGNNKHLHHIVAQSASAAGSAQWVLWEVFPDLGVNHPLNLVFVSQRVHQRLHTKVYYIMVNQRIYSAYISAGWDKRQQVLNVAQELLALKIFILSLDAASS